MNIRNILREYFSFSRNERIGLYVLILLVILLGVANRIIFYFETPGEADRQEFEALFIAFEKNKHLIGVKDEQSLFNFDPNRIDSVALDSLDLPYFVKKNLWKYRLKGGCFQQKEDFKKLYGITDSLYTEVEPFIHIFPVVKPKRETFETKNIVAEKVSIPIELIRKSELKKIEINEASVADLKSLYGVGEVLSARIVKYRNLLGGFYRIEQLRETYGLPLETYDAILPRLRIDTCLIKKININFASEKELVHHPYLNWHDVEAITAFRSQHGFINEVSCLDEFKVLNDSLYKQIFPYFKTKD